MSEKKLGLRNAINSGKVTAGLCWFFKQHLKTQPPTVFTSLGHTWLKRISRNLWKFRRFQQSTKVQFWSSSESADLIVSIPGFRVIWTLMHGLKYYWVRLIDPGYRKLFVISNRMKYSYITLINALNLFVQKFSFSSNVNIWTKLAPSVITLNSNYKRSFIKLILK